jgi:hypothetical protein
MLQYQAIIKSSVSLMFSQFFKKNSEDKTTTYRSPTTLHEKKVASKIFNTSIMLISVAMYYLPAEAQATLALGILLGGYLGYGRVINTNQNAIRSNLATFMRQTSAAHEVTLRENLESRGQCFGLSVCHAAMHAIGKLRWWEAALVELANWDGSPAALDRKVTLPDADESDPVPLKKIFERMLNYITVHQATHKSKIENLYQYNLFDPENKYFELIDTHGKIKTVCLREVAACNFTLKSLSTFFDDHLEKAICILSNTTHSININYMGNQQWMVYNANYSHESTQTLHKIFFSKEAAAKEIISILGCTLAMEVAHFNSPKTNSVAVKFAELIDREKMNLLKNGGLHKLVTSAPEYLPQLLATVDGDNEAIMQVLEYLITKGKNERTGFSFITEYVPDSLPAILHCIRNIYDAPQLIAHVLAAQDSRYWTGLHVTAKFAAKQLPILLDFIENEQSAMDLLRQAWKSENRTGNSAADFVSHYVPDCVDRIEDLIRQYPSLPRFYR